MQTEHLIWCRVQQTRRNNENSDAWVCTGLSLKAASLIVISTRLIMWSGWIKKGHCFDFPHSWTDSCSSRTRVLFYPCHYQGTAYIIAKQEVWLLLASVCLHQIASGPLLIIQNPSEDASYSNNWNVDSNKQGISTKEANWNFRCVCYHVVLVEDARCILARPKLRICSTAALVSVLTVTYHGTDLGRA